MKHIMLGLLSLAALASCAIKDDLQPAGPSRHFRAVMEQPVPDPATKAYATHDADLDKYFVFWNRGDRVSIFHDQTYNREYEFLNRDGNTAGDFGRVGTDPSPVPGQAIASGYQYAVYPYHEGNTLDAQGNMTIVIPEQQTYYYDDARGIGARMLMVARDPNGDFTFKHVGSYLGVRLKGEGVSVASITFQGNNHELIAGYPQVSFDENETPVLTFDPNNASEVITMTLDTPVALNSEEYEVFWLMLPPITLSEGLTLIAKDTEGGIYEQKITNSITLERRKFYTLSSTAEFTPAPLDESSYAKATSITVGGTYLVVDVADQRLFKGATDGSYLSVSPVDGIITDTDGTLVNYEFTVEQSGSNYYLKFNDGKYLVCDYGTTNGNSTTGLRYVASQADAIYPYALTVSDGAFLFSTTQMSSTSSTDQVLYYKPSDASGSGTNRFKIGESGRGVGVHLYMKGGKQDRGLKFEPEEVICLQGNTPQKPELSGTYTTVRYSSDNTAVATVDGNGNVSVIGIGTATITAEADEDAYYQAGTASYTLTVLDGSTASYVKASAITVGGTYLVVDATNDTRAFKGAQDGSYVSVSPENGIIIDYDRTLSAYEFTVEQGAKGYYLKFNDGKYLICDYSNSGNTTTGIRYVATQDLVDYPYSLTVTNGVFFFSTTQVNNGSTDQILYYKPSNASGSGTDKFKIGGTGSDYGVHLYLKGGKRDRGLKFEPEEVICLQGNTPEKPVLSGTYTTVRYSSDNTSVATVNASNGTVTVNGIGTATITASVDADDDYLAGTASYTLTVLDPNGSTYTKVSSITVGGTYLVVDATNDTRAFKGAQDGSYVSVSPVGGVITDTDRTLTAYEFTVEQGAKGYYLKFNDGKYLICDYSNSGNTTTGIRYVATQDLVDYPYSLTVTNGVFFFSTTQVNNGSTDQILYYKPSNASGSGTDKFKIGGTGSDYGVHLYLKGGGGTPGKPTQTISFSQPTVTWTLGQGYELNGSYALPQTVTGNKTSVTYTSETPDVVTLSNNRITIVAAGSATIKATAAETEDYSGATATFTLNIATPAPEGWVDLKSFNLENELLYNYLNEAERDYTDTNESGTGKVSYASKYRNQYSSMSRQDIPNPVTITWTNPASTSTVITIYSDDTLTDAKKVWSQNVTTANAKSAEVYNLIPGRKYYYTVSENGSIWEKGYFNTTGRRRMLKISDTKAKGHANNCRDLGGMVTKDGTKRIKYGYLFRGSNMDKTTPAEKAILHDYLNIRTDVDLRQTPVQSSSGNSDDGNSRAYRAFPEASYPDMDYIAESFNSQSDLSTASKVKNTINKIIDTVLDDNAAYFHCYVGADRTGYFGVLIEGLLGISEAVCSMDYEMTSFSVVGLRGRDGSGEDWYFTWGLNYLRGKDGSTFQQKCNDYLVSIGVTQTRIDQFRNKVLEANN